MKKIIIINILLIYSVSFLFGHPMPNSVVLLNVKEKNIEAELQIPLSDLEIAFGNRINQTSNTSLDSFKTNLKTYIKNHLKIVSNNNQNWAIDVQEINLQETKDSASGIYNELIINCILTPPNNENNRNFTMYYDVVLHQVVTHSALVSVRQDWKNGISTEQQPLEVGVIAWDIPSNNIYPFKVNLSEGSTWKGFKSMFSLGMKHIWEGTDHLLFLLVLLLPSPLLVENKRWTKYIGLKDSLFKLIRIITAFTLGHSITLLLGTIGLVTFSSRWIEILIAFTILISAIHALYPIFYKKEIYIAASFGLIHGLAFSSTLSDLELSPTQTGLSILGFNLGIEAMQLFIMAIILPCFLIIANNDLIAYKNVKNINVIFAIIASLSWVVQRFTEKDNPLTPYLDKAPEYLVLFISIIILYAVWIWAKKNNKLNVS